MKNEMRPINWIALVLLFVLAIVAVIVVNDAGAEALPSPDAKTMLALEGDLKLSDAPLDIHVAECLRVDVVSDSENGTWADLTLPKGPPGIVGVALFDGWHLIYGVWQQTGENTLRLRFWPEDVARLDGSVGVYLVILAEGGDSGE